MRSELPVKVYYKDTDCLGVATDRTSCRRQPGADVPWAPMPRHPHASSTTSSLSDRVYSALADKARAAQGPVFPLHVGDTYLDPIPSARSEAQRIADHPRLHNYAPVQGEPALLDAIAHRLWTRTAERVDRALLQVMLGATGGFAVVCDALLDPGDEVVVLAPFWPLIRGIVASRGAIPVQVPFFDRLGQDGFDPEAAVERAITDRTVAIYVNSPNNPTGRMLPDDVVAALARSARRHGLWVLADEVYEDLCYAEPAPPLWMRADLRERTVSTYSVSKSFALAGARVGYTLGPAAAMAAIRGVQTFRTYCAPRPMQFAAARALTEGDAWLAETRELYRAAGAKAAAVLGLAVPEGGTFLFFDARRHLGPGEDLAGFLDRCLSAGVLLTPGTAAGAAYTTWARLCYTAVPPAELDQALERLAGVLG